MFIVFHRSDLRISVKLVHLVVAIFIIPYFYFDGVCHCFIALHVHECVSEFRGYFQKMKKVMENVADVLPTFADISSNVRTGVNSSFLNSLMHSPPYSQLITEPNLPRCPKHRPSRPPKTFRRDRKTSKGKRDS